MARLAYNELKAGTLFLMNEEPYQVLESDFLRMQQRKPVMRLKIRSLLSGKTSDYTAHQNETFEEAEMTTTPVRFIYHNRGEYWFTDLQDPKKRFALNADTLGASAVYLKENTEARAMSWNGTVINVALPVKIDLVVREAPPALRGNTAQGGTKVAVLETGAKVNVPLFVNEGDTVRINTQTGEYVERVEKGI